MAKLTSTKNGALQNAKSATADNSEAIAQLAYQFFLERGGEHGHDLEDWTRAEAVIRQKGTSGK